MIELFDWQKPSRERLVEIFRSGSLIAGNFSDCGSGKTYVGIDVVRTLGKRAFVVCPKMVLSAWIKVAEQMGCPDILVGVCNVEKLLAGNTQWVKFDEKKLPKWSLPDDTILLWDEVHKGTADEKSRTNTLLAITRVQKIPVLAMSATPAASPLGLRGLGYLFELHQFNKSSFYRWVAANGCTRNQWNGYFFPKGPKGQKIMAAIGEKMSDRSVRIRIDEIPNFPECETSVELVDLSDEETRKVNEAYAEMVEKLSKPNANPLTDIMRARQIAEIQKVTVFFDKMVDLIEGGNSVVAFLNFRESAKMLAGKLKEAGIGVAEIHGVSSAKESQEREQALRDFQDNKLYAAVCICSAGGAGVGFHDAHRVRPRRALISPDFSSTVVRQVLGRIHRAGASKAIQTFLLAANTAETKVYASVVGKMKNLDSLLEAEVFDLTKY